MQAGIAVKFFTAILCEITEKLTHISNQAIMLAIPLSYIQKINDLSALSLGNIERKYFLIFAAKYVDSQVVELVNDGDFTGLDWTGHVSRKEFLLQREVVGNSLRMEFNRM
ncbi:hypothetical protein AVEN_109847-1 [Araneus ventricosus]|uniref:Uncharacterized protein n=1 Tax=Araneus ventricosus TaxID=182803 RepID=A0A4Y2L7D6_ARAVE|nr:hypothetical protein AVEN_109847-1 [Araneus ventricosus]